jgi:serine/threonine protein phosphatase PrpC
VVSLAFAFTSAGQTHVGRVRTVNEDAFLERPSLGLWAVADGMGGHRRGDVASRMIVSALADLPVPGDARTLRRSVESAISEVNDRLRADSADGSISGSTVVLLLVHARHFAVLWAGDSRVYRLAADGLELLTHDHSVVQELVDRGEISPAAARHHPLGNQITRAVGAAPDLVLDAVQGELRSEDRFLLCSDGLTRHLTDEDIRQALEGSDPDAAVRQLIEATLDRGGTDNVTAIVVMVGGAEERTFPPRPAGP